MFEHSRHNIDVIIKITYDDYNLKYFNQLKYLYPTIKDCKFVPDMSFSNNYLEVPYCGKSLNLLKKVSINEKKIIKQQLILFMKEMFVKGIAHRDLWIKNICWDGNQIWIIDWEYITKHHPKNISDHYDLTGKGLESPELSDHMNVFHNAKKSVVNWLMPITLSITEFD